MNNVHENLDRFLRQAAYWLLVGLALAVPSLNQPTKLMAVLLLLAVIVRLPLRGGALPRAFDAFDYALVAIVLASLLSSAFGLPSSGRYQGLAEALSQLVAVVAIRHGGYGREQLRGLGMALVAGAVLAALVALYAYLVEGVRPISLPAVTGSIRSSLYVGIALLLAIGLTIGARGGLRWMLLACILLLGVVLLAMTSRAVILTTLAAIVLALIARYRSRTALPLAVVACLVVVGYLSLTQSSMKKFVDYKAAEMVDLVASGTVSRNDQYRIDHWRVALAWIRTGDHWLFGVGPRNMISIDASRLNIDPPLQYPDDVRHPNHAHNMYLTKYIEEGVVGLAAMLVLFVLVAWRLMQDVRAGRTEWAWWAALGGLLVPCINGVVGSPWFREYAWLAVVSFALYLAVPATRR
jgi:O-antigen ligase